MIEHHSIYQSPAVLAASRHATWSIKAEPDYRFATQMNAVPLVTSEFAIAALEYPIVFAQSETGTLPVALTGLRDGENLFVSPEGQWQGHYVPVILRQYPFGVARVGENQKATLCIDEASTLISHEGAEGHLLFAEDGSGTDYLKQMAEMAKQLERARQATLHFGARLKELDLFDARQMNFKETDGQNAVIRGFSIVDRERLQALPAETAKELLSNGALELIHTHLISLGSRERLMERLPPRTIPQGLH